MSDHDKTVLRVRERKRAKLAVMERRPKQDAADNAILDKARAIEAVRRQEASLRKAASANGALIKIQNTKFKFQIQNSNLKIKICVTEVVHEGVKWITQGTVREVGAGACTCAWNVSGVTKCAGGVQIGRAFIHDFSLKGDAGEHGMEGDEEPCTI